MPSRLQYSSNGSMGWKWPPGCETDAIYSLLKKLGRTRPSPMGRCTSLIRSPFSLPRAFLLVPCPRMTHTCFCCFHYLCLLCNPAVTLVCFNLIPIRILH
ncbi:hypothetical protein BS17DRAFT_602536 [Gyrodon lividus]|nr:hypothetical protein BS17DRAFT_602536 [Gyrodon lividus]